MKLTVSRSLLVLLAVGLSGCGSEHSIDAGVPQNVDMSKSYTPAVPVGPIRPGDVKKAKGSGAETKGASGGAAPLPITPK